MQRNDMVALVAGTSIGVVGGALGAVLACTAGEATLYHLLDRFSFGDQYVVLRPPAVPTAQRTDLQTSLDGTSLSPPAGALPLPHDVRAVTTKWQAAGAPVAVSRTSRLV